VTRPTEIVAQVATLLESIGVRYHVGGSVASSAHGMYRASADADFVIDATALQLESLADALETDFYVARTAMTEALSHRTSFNAIHNETSFKVAFFVKGWSAFDDKELRRSVRVPVGEHGPLVLIKSPEDTILQELDWCRRGGEVSERLWQDVLSVLAAARGQLDEQHLERWSRELGVADLLARARAEVADL
jgi:hypothetical protein